jgi:hypothetical protein
MEPLAVFLFCIIVLGIYAFQYFIGFPSNHSLTPFQGGILYRRGRPVKEVGPGRHRVFVGSEKIIFLDNRPVQVSIENRAVALADGVIAVYGFAASAEVNDIRKALYASAAYSQVPAFVALCVTRGVLNRCRSDQFRLGRAALEEEIAVQCRSRLAAAGFGLLSFRLTQLCIAAPPPPGI